MDRESLGYVGKQLLFVLSICLLAILVFGLGLVVGYGVVGGSDHMWSILSPDKWSEILSKFTGK